MAEQYAQLAVSLLVLLVLFWGMRAWRVAVVEMSRQRAFRLRARLFDAAAKADALEDPAYLRARLILNGYLRTIHVMSGFLLLWTFFTTRRKDSANLDTSGPMEADLREGYRELASIFRLHMALCGPDTLFALGLMSACGKARKLVRIINNFFGRAGGDDDFARHFIDHPMMMH